MTLRVDSPPVPAAQPHAWGVVALLCIGGIISMLDRQVLILLVEPIKASLAISDTQVSLLQGFAVAIFYGLLAVPLGRLADSGNRTQIIAAGALFFSLSTMAGGFAVSFGALFATRLCVGIGEATLTPAGSSLIGDYLPPHKVGRAMGLFIGSSFVGSGLALVIIGSFLAWLTANPLLRFPLIGRPEDWQMVFIAASLPGLFFAAAMLLVREPPRSEGLALAGARAGSASIAEVMAFVRSNARLLLPVFLGLPLLAGANFSLNSWTPTFFIRTYGWTAAEIGPIFGLMITLLATAGVITGGWLSDRMLARGRTDANLSVSMAAALAAVPFIIAFPLAGSATASLLLLGPVLFLAAMPFGAGPAAIPILAPNRMRAQLMAVYLLFANLFGAGMGPWMVAAFTDSVLGDPQAIRWSIALVCSAVMLAGALIVGLGARAMRHAALVARPA
ncbi:MFS transporter [Polymorphobacter sp.]|uniref:MFS transporter n=1 Tax=Polymorphobacter sp. TaxID=1909290 RepID=UPI003F72AC03